jgi:Protein involved in inorganic phosphate transport
MNSGLLFPMLMLWFLHFKMGQVQPLFFQTANGIKDFVMSPLFQVYVLGRNLERPFRNKKMEDLQKNQQQMMLGMQEGDENDQDGSNVVGEEMNESANDVNESEMESALNVDSEDDNDVDDDDDEYEESSEEDDYDDDTMKKIEKNEDS